MISAEYLAGFFDGEGCISLNISGQHKQVVPRVILTNTNTEFLKLIQIQFGGRLATRQLQPNWKPTSHLIWTGPKAMEFLSILRPHIRIKKAQLELAFEYRNFATTPRKDRCISNGFRTGMKRSAQTKLIELDFKNRMHQLNKKGVANG